MTNLDASGAALVCGHIADESKPIRVAFRIGSAGAPDTGWQFFCGAFLEEKPEDARIWSLRDVLEEEPELGDLISLPEGTELVWEQGNWQIRDKDVS